MWVTIILGTLIWPQPLSNTRWILEYVKAVMWETWIRMLSCTIIVVYHMAYYSEEATATRLHKESKNKEDD